MRAYTATHLGEAVPEEVTHVLATLADNGHRAFVAGGAVRDMIMGNQPKDWDIATCALPDAVSGMFPKVIPTGVAYGTVTVIHNELPIEVTTFRMDSPLSDGRRPDKVKFTTDALIDVLRRDSTVNGMLYYNGEVHDYVGGLASIERKEICSIGDPHTRIEEDALRMLRYIRQATQLGFEVEEDTYHAIMCNRRLISNVSWERVRDELNKILLSKDPARGMGMLLHVGLLGLLIPELAKLHHFDQHNKHHDKDVWSHTMDVLGKVPADLNTRWAALLHDVGKPETFTLGEDGAGHFYGHHVKGGDIASDILTRLKFPLSDTAQIATLVREHMSRIPHLRSPSIKRFIKRVGEDNLQPLFDVMLADTLAHVSPYWENLELVVDLRREVAAVIEAGEPMRVTDLAINGADLKGLGLTPGPIYGEVLEGLLNHVLDNPDMNYKEVLLDMVRSYIRKAGYA